MTKKIYIDITNEEVREVLKGNEILLHQDKEKGYVIYLKKQIIKKKDKDEIDL